MYSHILTSIVGTLRASGQICFLSYTDPVLLHDSTQKHTIVHLSTTVPVWFTQILIVPRLVPSVLNWDVFLKLSEEKMIASDYKDDTENGYVVNSIDKIDCLLIVRVMMIMKMWTVPSTSERASLPWVTPGSSLAPHGSPVQPDTLATHS